MLSLRHIGLLIAVFVAVSSQAQQSYKGSVYDSKTREPVPFATLRILGKEGGMIANEDGKYFLPVNVFQKTDTVLISCVGFLARKIAVSSLRDSSRIGLIPVVYNLKEVNVSAKGRPDYLYRMFFEACQKYRKTDDKLFCKAYFSFLSECNSEPLEIIEAYYNASVSAAEGVSALNPKNGRIGLTMRNFWSLNTTDIIRHLHPFLSGGHYSVPEAAGNLNYHNFKESYWVNLVKHSTEGNGSNYVLRLVPKSDSVSMFESTVYINEQDNTIGRIENQISDVDFYYLRAQVKGDRTDSVFLAWSVDFDNTIQDEPRISRISLDYSLVYLEKLNYRKTKLKANAELILYDYNRPYLGILGYPGDQINDYQRLLSIPHDSLFWINPGITPESKKQTRFRNFFSSNGVLLNYKTGMNSFIRSAYLPWTSERNLEFYELGPPPSSAKTVYLPSGPGKDPPKQGFRLAGSIVVNPVVSGDSIRFGSSTIVNARESFINERQSYRATAFINVIFDLYELKRREIVNCFHQKKFDPQDAWTELREMYNNEMSNLQDSIRLFSAQSWEGTNVSMILYWYSHVSSKLGIQRKILMERMVVEEQERKKRRKKN